MAARRRREPVGWMPVRRSWRSSRGVETVLGSRFGGGDGGGEVDVVASRASSLTGGVVVKVWVEERGMGPRRAGFRRQRSAGRMTYTGIAMFNGCMIERTHLRSR